MKMVLTSFKTCPYAQMALLMCYKSQLEPEVQYINLNKLPQWFKELSPTGAVPMLQIDDEVIFDSRAIIELINEISPHNIHPKNAIQAAKNRAWMAFAMDLFTHLFELGRTTSREQYQSLKTNLSYKLNKVANFHSGLRFFSGDKFSLVEVAFAPFFMRLDWINEWTNNVLNVVPKPLKTWQQNILAQDYVKNSVADDNIGDVYMSGVEQAGGILASLIVEQ